MFIQQRPKTRLKQTQTAKSLRSVREDLAPAFAANAAYACHLAFRAISYLHMYCAKSGRRLRLQYRDEMPQLVFHIARHRDGLSDLLAQQYPISLTQAMECLLHGIFSHAQLLCDLCLRRPARLVREHLL